LGKEYIPGLIRRKEPITPISEYITTEKGIQKLFFSRKSEKTGV
jgi:hypothetical protein